MSYDIWLTDIAGSGCQCGFIHNNILTFPVFGGNHEF
jgi:hypothetical protein